MIKQLGFRGYISSRPVMGNRVPQHVQNLVIRDYCSSHNIHFLLSATEYAMPNCYIMLEHALKEAVNNQGVVLYSVFQLPQNSTKRKRIYNLILENQIEMHSALEGIVIKDQESAQRVEDIWLVHQTLNNDNSSGTKSEASVRGSNGIFAGFLDYGRN
ncbi:LIC12192 family sporadic carbohydrate cluster protein [Kaarinaea lacus]